MKTYHYENSTALQAALQRRATRAHSVPLPRGAADAIRVCDQWVAVFSGKMSTLVRVSSELSADNNGHAALQLVLTPDSKCYLITRGPLCYTLDAVSVQYLRRYCRPAC